MRKGLRYPPGFHTPLSVSTDTDQIIGNQAVANFSTDYFNQSP